MQNYKIQWHLISVGCRGSDLNMTAKRPVGFLKNKSGEELVGLLLGTLNQLSLDTLVAHGRDIRHILRQTVSFPSFGVLEKYSYYIEKLNQYINIREFIMRFVIFFIKKIKLFEEWKIVEINY